MKKLLAFLFLLSWAGFAQAVQPLLNDTHPNGGQRGSELTVEFRGDRLEDTKEIIFYSPGFEVGHQQGRQSADQDCAGLPFG
jgi:hypothetical protein